MRHSLFGAAIRQEVHLVEEVLESTFSREVVSEVLMDALDRTTAPASRTDLVDFVRGPLRTVVADRLGTDVAEEIQGRIEARLGVAPRANAAPPLAASPRVTVPPPLAASLKAPPKKTPPPPRMDSGPLEIGELEISVEFDAEPERPRTERAHRTTLQVPSAGESAVPILLIESRTTVSERLKLELGNLVRVSSVSTEDALRRAVFAVAPLLVVVDAEQALDLGRGALATCLRRLPNSAMPVIWGCETPFGQGLVSALAEAGVEAITLKASEGFSSLRDLAQSRRGD